MFQDYLLYATDVDMRYAYRMLNLSTLAQHAQTLHALNHPRAIVLAESLVGGMLLASILEGEESINVRIQAGDDFTVACETTRHAQTRGYVEFNEKSPLVAAIDRSLPLLTDFHVRSLRWQAGVDKLSEGHSLAEGATIEQAFNEHLGQSYQMRTHLKIESWVDTSDNTLRAYGVIFMELPNLEAQAAQNLWTHIAGLPSLQKLVSQSEDPDVIASALIPDLTKPIRSDKPIWSCGCSQISVESMLVKLPHEELVDMESDNKPVEVSCHYCSKNYVVTIDRIRELIADPQSVSREAKNEPVKN